MKGKIILIVLLGTAAILSTSPLSAKEEADKRGEWAGSSLTFVSGCEGDCQLIKAILCNTGDGPMQDSVEWELFYSPQGNPKWGEVIERGIILPLEAGECVELSYQPSQSGNYMWRVEQEEGHPGKGGEVWSEACGVICEQMTPTIPFTITPLPTSTPTPTSQIFPTPSPTPSPTPPAISSPTPTPTVEGEKEAEEVFSVKIEEVPPPPTGGRGLEDISYPLFCQGGSLLFILATMGLAIRPRS